MSSSRRKPLPRVYHYGLRQRHEADLADFEQKDDEAELSAAGSSAEQMMAGRKYEKGAGVFARPSELAVPNQNQNQNQQQVFSLENEADEFMDGNSEQFYTEEEETKLPAYSDHATSSVGEMLRQAWSMLLLTIGGFLSSIAGFIHMIWHTKIYRYGLLGLLLMLLLLYFYPPTQMSVPSPEPVKNQPDDLLPLNVEIFLKKLVEQQLANKQDDMVSRVIQKMVADKEELKRKTKDELLAFLDAKLDRMDTMIRSRLNAPTTDDTLAQELKDLEARIKADLQKMAKEVKTSNQGIDERQRSLQTQFDALQRRLNDFAAQVNEGSTVPGALQETWADIKELRNKLDGLMTSQKQLEQRMTDEAVQAEIRIQKSESNLSDHFKEEIARIRDELKQHREDQKHEPLDQRALVDEVFDKVLAQWNNEKDALRQEFNQLIESVRASDKQPIANTPSAREIVAAEKDTILDWVGQTVSQQTAKLKSDHSKLAERVDKISSTEIVNQARDLILSWIVEQNSNSIPKMVEAAQEKIVPSLEAKIVLGEKQIESQQKQIDALGERQDQLASSLTALSKEKSTTVLSDAQLREIVQLVNKNRAVGSPSLSEDQVKELIREELEFFAADRVNMSDWALGAAGARIIHEHTSDRYGSSAFGYLLGQVGEPPAALLTPSLTLGHCWAFTGAHGNATIALPDRIRPTAFSLDHVARSVARDWRSAPQNFRVWGFGDRADLSDDSKAVLLGDFRYDIYGAQVQTFHLPPTSEQLEQRFSVVKLEVTSNYGHPDYTCVYRFRVHGEK